MEIKSKSGYVGSKRENRQAKFNCLHLLYTDALKRCIHAFPFFYK